MAYPNKKRLQFDFSPQMLKTLDFLKEETGAATSVEVVRRAIKLAS